MLVLLGRRAPSGEGPISGRLPTSCHITMTAFLERLSGSRGCNYSTTLGCPLLRVAKGLPNRTQPKPLEPMQHSCIRPGLSGPCHAYGIMLQHSRIPVQQEAVYSAVAEPTSWTGCSGPLAWLLVLGDSELPPLCR